MKETGKKRKIESEMEIQETLRAMLEGFRPWGNKEIDVKSELVMKATQSYVKELKWKHRAQRQERI